MNGIMNSEQRWCSVYGVWLKARWGTVARFVKLKHDNAMACFQTNSDFYISSFSNLKNIASPVRPYRDSRAP